MSSPVWMPSPCPSLGSGHNSELSEANTPPPLQPPPCPAKRMFRIQSLLNPAAPGDGYQSTTSLSPPPTPAYTVKTCSTASTPVPQTPSTPGADIKRQKLTKDAPVFSKGQVKGIVNFPPHESIGKNDGLSSSERQSLIEQHQRFKIYPSGRDDEGRIGDYVRHIPYSSEKKKFFASTGRDAFDGKSRLSYRHQRQILT